MGNIYISTDKEQQKIAADILCKIIRKAAKEGRLINISCEIEFWEDFYSEFTNSFISRHVKSNTISVKMGGKR
jgi:hypothetical protein